MARLVQGPVLVDYSNFSVEDLRRAVDGRAGPGHSKKSRNRKVLLRILRQLDRDWKFRFLDLSPEVRVRVYDELFSRTAGGRYFEILRTSKEIEAEAANLVYADREFTFTIDRTAREGNEGKGVDIDLRFNNGFHNRNGDIYTLQPTFPSVLRKITNLRIQITLDSHIGGVSTLPDSRLYQINHALYALSSFLSTETRLKKVIIQYYARDVSWGWRSRRGRTIAPEPSPELLYPVTRLKKFDSKFRPLEFSFVGIPNLVKQDLRHQLAVNKTSPTATTMMTTVTEMLALREEITRLLRQVDTSYSRLDLLTVSAAGLLRLFDEKAVIDSERDNEFQRQIMAVKGFADECASDVVELKKEVEVNEQVTRLAFEEAQAEGVLEAV